jgi:hypothetical protein
MHVSGGRASEMLCTPTWLGWCWRTWEAMKRAASFSFFALLFSGHSSHRTIIHMSLCDQFALNQRRPTQGGKPTPLGVAQERTAFLLLSGHGLVDGRQREEPHALRACVPHVPVRPVPAPSRFVTLGPLATLGAKQR